MTLAAFWKHRRGNPDPGKAEPVAREEHERIAPEPIPALHGLMRDTLGTEAFADRLCGVTEKVQIDRRMFGSVTAQHRTDQARLEFLQPSHDCCRGFPKTQQH
jgi:hypothetical protein